MLRLGDKGTDVGRLQRALMAQGIDLPEWGADEDFGSETQDGVTIWLAAHHGLVPGDDPTDDVIPDETLAAIIAMGEAAAAFTDHERRPRFPAPTPAPSGDRYTAIVNGEEVEAPAGLMLINWLDGDGIPALLSKYAPERKLPPTQLVFHRGSEIEDGADVDKEIDTEAEAVEVVGTGDEDDPMRTKRILDRRELSSMFTLTPAGVLYQHFDAAQRGRHATHHNVQSDSVDVQGPLSRKRRGIAGQELLTLPYAIGRKSDAASKARGREAQQAAILARRYVKVKQWGLTPQQQRALALFVPWWCELRGIPLRACDDWRTFRVGGKGRKDPTTDVTGLLAHTQISGPGQRVDGCVALHALKQSGVPIEWRPGPEFWT